MKQQGACSLLYRRCVLIVFHKPQQVGKHTDEGIDDNKYADDPKDNAQNSDMSQQDDQQHGEQDSPQIDADVYQQIVYGAFLIIERKDRGKFYIPELIEKISEIHGCSLLFVITTFIIQQFIVEINSFFKNSLQCIKSMWFFMRYNKNRRRAAVGPSVKDL